MIRLERYVKQRAEVVELSEAILAAAEADSDGILSDEQQTEFDGLKAKRLNLDASIAREREQIEAERSAPAVITSKGNGEGPDKPLATDIRLRAEDDRRRGFKDHREFILAAIEHSGYRSREQVADERLRVLAVAASDDKRAAGELAFMLPQAFTPAGLRGAAGSDEQGVYDAQYGGFSVVPTFLPGQLALGFEGDPSAGRTQNIPMATPTVKMLARTDKDHSTSVSGGFTVTRKNETAAAISSRMSQELVTLDAASLFGLAIATEELLADSMISFVAMIRSGFDDQFAHHMFNEKLRGLGGSEYQGILKALASDSTGPTIAIAKETGQAKDTIVLKNVQKARARCWGYGQSIWISNHDTYPELASLQLPVGTGGSAVYQPSVVEDRPDTLLGRPIFYSEYPETLGDAGDLILANWSEYLEGLYQPLQSAESVHVRFDTHERMFKFWLRNAGAPWWRVPLTPNKGANTLSPFVIIAARA